MGRRRCHLRDPAGRRRRPRDPGRPDWRPLEQEFGWSRAVIPPAVAINIALFGLIGPFAASVMDRWGLRRVIRLRLSPLHSRYRWLLTTQMRNQWQLQLLWGVLVEPAPASRRWCWRLSWPTDGSMNVAGWSSVRAVGGECTFSSFPCPLLAGRSLSLADGGRRRSRSSLALRSCSCPSCSCSCATGRKTLDCPPYGRRPEDGPAVRPAPARAARRR